MTTPTQQPTAQELLAKMRAGMGRVPAAIEKSTVVDDGLIQEHMRSRMYAMPADGALDEQTRTLIYLAAALAGSSPACVRAMADKVVQQGIPKAKVLETVHIARFAMATKMIGDAEPVFDALVGAKK
ncbi:Carboxymuconolactone decarboxylase [Thiomonas arsenitoxydans]|uniref:Carboxymuconolactone decarboxylase n=1 Tax=Thiomonas arsenitoxydans (strain DSM 22701 / CIP 110005 / 3As) TaxID=426114 RepID=A0ABM9T3Z8_THIA3|nr:carboxymuconolactone decarboxylase family protein [Thiomonas arsenitoxydans]OYV29313.1 MAG: carboxymuconolactone decarboxylase [Thiomonas sp. 20-64-9]CQR43024.1 Carboxymuconolactone decarboxylase [Thiomonas sp. CB3]CQR31664.1 Carboxymuconolactone decarboxylase [Thiomonas arsenitoxydans]CQR36751.1 Carboxymuconolactone decarboxylase [Thiomonas arsenitoxydans]CQR45683.1 Carboxymuconolactone decarboxylase [Thiomonas sp. CB3]